MAIQRPLAIFSLLAGCGGGMLAFMAFAEVKGFGVNRRFPLAVAALVITILYAAGVFAVGKFVPFQLWIF